MIKNRHNKKLFIIVAVLLAIAFVSRMIYEDLTNAMAQAIMLTVRNSIHISLLFMWVVSLHRRLMNKNVRRLMLAVGCLMLFWLIDKIVKWDFTGSVTHPLVRYLWYGFYVGMLFIPTLGAFIINYLGKPENYSHPARLNYLLIPPAVLLALVFTNDLHQKVFVFYNGFINFDMDYSYDWVYYIVMGWFIVMGFYFVVSMLLKSRVPGSRRLQKMPILIMIFAALFWTGYSMRLYNCDLTVTDILIIVLLLGILQLLLKGSQLGDIILPNDPTAMDRGAVQQRPPHMNRPGFRLTHLPFRNRQCSGGNIVGLIIPVNDLDRNGGSVK